MTRFAEPRFAAYRRASPRRRGPALGDL